MNISYQGPGSEGYSNISISDATATVDSPEELDLATRSHLGAALEGALGNKRISKLVVNMGRTSFLDVAGLRVLMDYRHKAVEEGKEFQLKDPMCSPLKVLEITNTIHLFDIHPPHISESLASTNPASI